MGYNRTDFKVSFDYSKTKFFVNEEKRTVVCVLEGELKVPIDWNKSFYIDPIYITQKGVAKCLKEDVFDVERGKRIALAKAENNAYLEALRHLKKYMDEMTFFMDAYKNFDTKVYYTCAHNDDYISSLSFEGHPNYKKDLNPLNKGE